MTTIVTISKIFFLAIKKINLFGSDARNYVRSNQNKELKPCNNTKGLLISIYGVVFYITASDQFFGLKKIWPKKSIYKLCSCYASLYWRKYAIALIPTIRQRCKITDPVRKFRVFPWSAQSPTLNRIKNLWSEMKHIISLR